MYRSEMDQRSRPELTAVLLMKPNPWKASDFTLTVRVAFTGVPGYSVSAAGVRLMLASFLKFHDTYRGSCFTPRAIGPVKPLQLLRVTLPLHVLPGLTNRGMCISGPKRLEYGLVTVK